jgi:hypothetical protein
MKINKDIIIGLFLLLSSCTMKGYQIDLNTMNQNNIPSTVKDILNKEGYSYQEAKIIQRHGSSEWLERFMKKPFSGKNESYFIYVDLIYQETENTPIEVWLYNVYRGNSPELKPLLTETADKIEREIKNKVPGIKIIRKEGLTGLPFI